jgi:cytochrome bd-type quinol oxidase subunit 2
MHYFIETLPIISIILTLSAFAIACKLRYRRLSRHPIAVTYVASALMASAIGLVVFIMQAAIPSQMSPANASTILAIFAVIILALVILCLSTEFQNSNHPVALVAQLLALLIAIVLIAFFIRLMLGSIK